jgi:hypothetical protein
VAVSRGSWMGKELGLRFFLGGLRRHTHIPSVPIHPMSNNADMTSATGDVYVSPGEPVFWLHHGQLDRHWWMWANYLSDQVKSRTAMYEGTSSSCLPLPARLPLPCTRLSPKLLQDAA